MSEENFQDFENAIAKEMEQMEDMMKRFYDQPGSVSLSEFLSQFSENQKEIRTEQYDERLAHSYELGERKHENDRRRMDRETRHSEVNYARKVEQNNIDRRDNTINQVLFVFIGIPIIVGVIAIIIGVFQSLLS